MNKLRLLAGAGALLLGTLGTPADAAPANNETNLSLFSCAATRRDHTASGGNDARNYTINHSHRIAEKSSEGHYDWFDCEGHDPVNILEGCVWATYYIYDVNPGTGQPYGIFGPFNVTCFS